MIIIIKWTNASYAKHWAIATLFSLNTWNYAVVERKITPTANSNLSEKESVNWFLCVHIKNLNDKNVI